MNILKMYRLPVSLAISAAFLIAAKGCAPEAVMVTKMNVKHEIQHHQDDMEQRYQAVYGDLKDEERVLGDAEAYIEGSR